MDDMMAVTPGFALVPAGVGAAPVHHALRRCSRSRNRHRSSFHTTRTAVHPRPSRAAIRCCTGQTLHAADADASLDHRTAIPAPSQIKLVASDVDGTLLNNQHAVSETNAATIRALLASGAADFVLATGKSRYGGYGALGNELAAELTQYYGGARPGVFLQGLLVYGRDGTLVMESSLEKEMASKVVELAHQCDVTFIAYCGDRILCEKTDQYTDDLQTYHEPVAEPMGDFQTNVIPHFKLHKFLLLASGDVIDRVRTIIEGAVSPEEATIVQALPTMLEVLPPGASKGRGVEALVKDFGLTPAQLMACGDAENDLEMLRMARLGCAVANASDRVKRAADVEILSNEENGVGHAIQKYVLRGQ